MRVEPISAEQFGVILSNAGPDVVTDRSYHKGLDESLWIRLDYWRRKPDGTTTRLARVEIPCGDNDHDVHHYRQA